MNIVSFFKRLFKKPDATTSVPREPSEAELFQFHFINGYTECALWTCSNNQIKSARGVALASDYGYSDFSPEAVKRTEADCIEFIRQIQPFLSKLALVPAERIGKAFWVTRNTPGAGFIGGLEVPKELVNVELLLQRFAEKFPACTIGVTGDTIYYLKES